MPRPKTITVPPLNHLGSLITYCDEDGAETCLGNLVYSPEHGVFDPTFGKVDVTREQAETHNRLLDEALVAGLDDRCMIGQGNHFYAYPNAEGVLLKTWSGIELGLAARIAGTKGTVELKRNGRVFRGHFRPGEEVVYLKRIS